MEKPSIPKGTRDFDPSKMAKRQFIFSQIKYVFQKYGFQPLETPAMENLSTLMGKYGEEGDQLVFKILNSGDFLKNGELSALKNQDLKSVIQKISEKGLRYDLTVPFARYVAMNRHEITFPFRRYQIQPVWRADRPQRGRYREFYQCDADVIGTDSLICEVEIILMIKEIFSLLGIKDYTIKINHRGILSGLAELVNAPNESSLFIAIDKLDKIGETSVKEELKSRGLKDKDIEVVFSILNFKGSISQKIIFLKEQFVKSEKSKKGIADLEQILFLLQEYGNTLEHVEFDMSLARGLTYYTGCIVEVKINQVSIGSVSGGGRYDNLTGVFGLSGISGVGISFGVDRLYDALEELNCFPQEVVLSAKVLVAHFNEPTYYFSLHLAQQLRSQGISTEVYPEVSKIKKQLEYANKKSIPFVIVIGEEEKESGVITIKDMKTGLQQRLLITEIINQLSRDTAK